MKKFFVVALLTITVFVAYPLSAQTDSVSPEEIQAQKPDPALILVPPQPSEKKMNEIPQTNTYEIATKFGSIVIELDGKAAPKTVANFKKLAAQEFYNGTTFHRVIPGFMIQGGDPVSKDEKQRARHGTGGPGYTVPAEIGLKHLRGSLATARLGDEANPKKESSGSQFFICVKDCPFLDGEYTVFGRVVKGMDVVDKIVAEKRDPRDNPLEPVEMKIQPLKK